MILTEPVAAYLREQHRPNDDVLRAMYEQASRERIPVVVPETGAFLELFVAATNAKRIVEVGTAIGVSTLRMARGGAHVTSFEIDEERYQAAQRYLAEAGLTDRVDLRLQDATVGLAELGETFDIGFIDGPKNLYNPHAEMILPMLKTGGCLLVDNALMSGTVATGEATQNWGEESIAAMRELNDHLLGLEDFIACVTPIGDGITLALRR